MVIWLFIIVIYLGHVYTTMTEQVEGIPCDVQERSIWRLYIA